MSFNKELNYKTFLHKSTTKAATGDAKGFLASHRKFLTSGNLQPLTHNLFFELDAGRAFPTPVLNSIRELVLKQMLKEEVEAGLQSIEKQKKREAERIASHKYWATVLNSREEVCQRIKANGEVEDLVKGFENAQRAQDWLDRALFAGESDWRGEVVHSAIKIKGEPWKIHIIREDSIARILKKKKSPYTYQRGKSTNKLGFGVKAQQDRVVYSKG